MSVRKISRRDMLKGFGLAAAGMVLAAGGGCQPKATEPAAGETKPVSQEEIELQVWNQDNYGLETWDQVYSDFEASHPGITIARHLMPFADIEPKILTAFAAEEPIDAVYVHPMTCATYALKGALLALDDYMPELGVPEDDWFPGFQFNTWRGRTWALPVQNAMWMLAYNYDLLEKAGLESPLELHKKGKWTLEVFDDYVQRLTKGEGAEKIFGADWLWGGSIRVGQSMWIWGFGGDIWNADETETLINSPQAIQAWEHMTRYQWEGWAPSPGDLEGVSRAAKLDRVGFATVRRVAYQQAIAGGKTPPVRQCPMFTMPNGQSSIRDATSAFGVFSKSDHRDEAWDFVRWMALDGNIWLTKLGWATPLRRSLMSEKWFVDSLIPEFEDAETITAMNESVRVLSHVPRLSEIDKGLIQPAWDRVLLKQVSAQEAMDEVKPDIDEILQEVAEEAKNL